MKIRKRKGFHTFDVILILLSVIIMVIIAYPLFFVVEWLQKYNFLYGFRNFY